jgi:hypothetical protein
MATWAVRSVWSPASVVAGAELAVIGLDRIVLVLLDVVPRHRTACFTRSRLDLPIRERNGAGYWTDVITRALVGHASALGHEKCASRPPTPAGPTGWISNGSAVRGGNGLPTGAHRNSDRGGRAPAPRTRAYADVGHVEGLIADRVVNACGDTEARSGCLTCSVRGQAGGRGLSQPRLDQLDGAGDRRANGSRSAHPPPQRPAPPLTAGHLGGLSGEVLHQRPDQIRPLEPDRVVGPLPRQPGAPSIVTGVYLAAAYSARCSHDPAGRRPQSQRTPAEIG